MSFRSVKWSGFVTLFALAATFGHPAAAQVTMSRPGMQMPPKRMSARTQQQKAVTLTADEQKRLNDIIKHMKRKDRQRLAAALQKMTPQQRQQLLASVKKQLANEPGKTEKRGW